MSGSPQVAPLPDFVAAAVRLGEWQGHRSSAGGASASRVGRRSSGRAPLPSFNVTVGLGCLCLACLALQLHINPHAHHCDIENLAV